MKARLLRKAPTRSRLPPPWRKVSRLRRNPWSLPHRRKNSRRLPKELIRSRPYPRGMGLRLLKEIRRPPRPSRKNPRHHLAAGGGSQRLSPLSVIAFCHVQQGRFRPCFLLCVQSLKNPRNQDNTGKSCFRPLAMNSTPTAAIINPMIRVTTLMPVLPRKEASGGAARKGIQVTSDRKAMPMASMT